MSEFAGNPEFAKLLERPSETDLVHVMLELAADAYPDLDRVGCLMEIDRLSVACCDMQTARGATTVYDRLAAVSETLYVVEGFHGNREHYYDPDNSYLNQVVARRRGIPISLGVLYMTVAARTGLKTYGVNTPGHFVVGCEDTHHAWYVDPFTGDVLNRCECKLRIDQMLGQRGVARDGDFQPAAPFEIVARVLRNLKAAYAMESAWPQVLRVQRRLTALLPSVGEEKRDLGLIYLRVGEPRRALRILESYVACCGDDEAATLGPSLSAARRMIAELN
jgi:regulator of sirC expression with transglutaminase-like and TPR domain